MKIKGVVGIGLGLKWTKGFPTGEPCVVVYVRKKLTAARLAGSRGGSRRIPSRLSWRGHQLPTDVVPFGRLQHHAVTAGGSAGPAGARIKGTIGAYAQDLQSGRTTAITAMHVSNEDEVPGDPPVRFVFPSLLDDASAAPFGTLVRGTKRGVDAAKIQLDAGVSVVNVIPAIGRIRGWRSVVFPGDAGTLVRLYGATTGYLEGQIVNPSIDLPQYQLSGAIVARIRTGPGDSGAALVDAQGLVLGFLVGMGSDMPADLRLFSPASTVLGVLGCDIVGDSK